MLLCQSRAAVDGVSVFSCSLYTQHLYTSTAYIDMDEFPTVLVHEQG